MHRSSFVGLGCASLIALTHVAAQTSPAPAAAAQTAKAAAYRYRLLGVYDEMSGAPLEGVEVEDVLNGNKSATSSTGTLSLFFLPDGGSLVRLKKIGYGSQTMTISISAADTTPVTVTLAKATELPTVVVKDSAPKPHVSAHMTTFENHRTQGFGQFITEDEMRKADNRSMANVLASKLTGVMLQPGHLSAMYLVSTRKPCSGFALLKICKGTNCFVSVYTDGIKTFDYTIADRAPESAQSVMVDFQKINVYDYAAVEFYPGGSILPEGVSPTNSDCGVLMLWTRER